MEQKKAERLVRDFASAAHELKDAGSLELGTPEGQLELAIRRLRYRRLRRRLLDELGVIEAIGKMEDAINMDKKARLALTNFKLPPSITE